MFDINSNPVIANVDPKKFPIRYGGSLSSIQENVGKKLIDKFKFYNILEEWPIPSSKLTVDFFIPQIGIVIEVDGEQHNKFQKFFHGTIENFLKQKERDKRKNEWCRINNFQMVRITNPNEVENL